MSPMWKKNVYNLDCYIHELEPVSGGQTACDGLVDKTNIPLLVAYLCTYFIFAHA